ncbi:MAG: hypothetical protein ABSE16_18850 [Verrucomicrobiota bacterium]
MSQIADALKRARQAQHNHPPSGLPPLPPTAPPPATPAPTPGRWPMVIVSLVAVAGCLVTLALARRSVARPVHVPPPMPVPAAAAVPLVVPHVPASQTNQPPLVATPGIPPPPMPQAAAAASPSPDLKLQGIVYGSGRSWAILGGKTVYVGDRIGEFRVIAISPSTITLEKADGSQQKLWMAR